MEPDIPDVEVTLDKVLDGYPLLYHLATDAVPSNEGAGSTTVTIQGELSERSEPFEAVMDIDGAEVLVTCWWEGSAFFITKPSGETLQFWPSKISWEFPGAAGLTDESVTLVGSNRVWNNET